MKKYTFALTVMAVAAMMGSGAITQAQLADASTFSDPMVLADASMEMKNLNAGDTASTSHHGTGVVKKIDANAGIVTLAHGPIASLNWPAMTMRFKLKDVSLATVIKPGDEVNFDFIQSGDVYVVTRLQPSGK